MFRCSVRMRPKVSQAYCVSQSGSCSLIELISPAAEASTSHTTAQERKTKATNAVERSASTRSFNCCASTAASTGASAGRGAASTMRCKPERWAAVAAGSSTVPISPSEKITLAASGFSSKSLLRSDQMKTNKPVTDNTNENSRMVMVSMESRQSVSKKVGPPAARVQL